MLPWLLRQLNITDEFTGHLQEVTLTFQHPLLLGVGLAVLVPISVFIYLRQKWNLPSVPTLLRLTLTGTRVAILLLLVLNGARPMLEALARHFELQSYGFSRDVSRLGDVLARPGLPEPPNPGGPGTHIGDAVAHVLDEAAGRPVAGILLFSDGQNTGG